ncbi:cytochrome c oxidase assembly protein [Planococcus donghaensis]|nr:cytochrome c oxidase assembly protein [Planococcus donghaensis]
MKVIGILFSVLLVLFLDPTESVLAHNDVDEATEAANLASQWSLWMAVALVVVLVAYVYQFKAEEDFFKKFAFFFSALVVLYVTLGSPLHVLGDHYLFSAHMLEQSLIYTLLPPLLLLGLPKRFVAPIVRLGIRTKILSFLKRPLIPLLMFNVLFSFYHIPLVFNVVVDNNVLHNLMHFVLTLTAFFMWIPLIPMVKELDTLSEIHKIGYIFAAGMLLTPACALIIFADQSFYTVYSDAPQLFASLPPLEDQRTGGIVMKVVQEIVYSTVIGYIFFTWARKERLSKVDPVPTNSFIEEVNQ